MSALIEVSNLCISYGKGAVRKEAVKELSFNVHAGECVGFIGINGAGKSTTIKTLMGFMRATSGTARLCGHPVEDPAARQSVGYLPETALYYPYMTAAELLMLYGTLSGMLRKDVRARMEYVLSLTGLTPNTNHLLRTFSKGMQQRLGIAQALIGQPELLVLDELSSGLDPMGRYDLRNLILKLKSDGKTIFFSSHELSEVESLCDRVLLIHGGRLLKEVTQEDLISAGKDQSLEAFFISQIREHEQRIESK